MVQAVQTVQPLRSNGLNGWNSGVPDGQRLDRVPEVSYLCCYEFFPH
jgi:hypothetical protein